MPSTFSSIARRIIPVLIVVVALASAAMAQADVQGKWSTASYQLPINPIHIALLYNGKVLIIAGSGNCPPSTPGCPSGPPYSSANGSGAILLDPVTTNITAFTLSWDMFCNGMVVLPDGRAFINGGTIRYTPSFTGIQKSAIFDPATNTFTDVPQNMAHGRWYPTVTTLGDGRIMTFSGTDENGSTNSTVEIYTVGSGWTPQYAAGFTPSLYPRMTLLPSGKVFDSGMEVTSRLFNPANQTWTTVGNHAWSGIRYYASTVLLPLTPANNYDPKIMSIGGGYTIPTATTEIIDMGASSPAWQFGPNMSQPRIEQNAVLLPNQKVLVLGGSSKDEDSTTASLNADLYDPASNTFSSAGANTYPRLYHSNGLLLPDASVWVAGSNPNYNVYESRVEIYQPAYLFTRDVNNNVVLATRPTISSAPSTIAWGGQFTLFTPDAANISSVVLVRPGAPTHAFDMDQRLVGMSFTKGSGTLTVTAPPNGNIAPPGYYMLFLLNSSGVPSVAKFTKLGTSGSGSAPTVSSISPTSGTTAGGTGVTITGTGFLAGATVSLGGSAATGVTVVSSTSITATTASHAAGTVNVVVSNPDAQSGTLASGYSYTTTNPAPTVSSISPTSGTTAGGTGVTITGTGFLAGATVSLGGSAATGVTVVSSTSITATTASHAAGTVNVVVSNPDAQSGTLTNGYSYTSSTGGGGIGFVQVNAATPQTASAAVILSYGVAQTAGNLNIVAVGWNDTTSTVSSVSDSRGNSYAQAGTMVTGTGLRQAIYYAKNIIGGSNTVTVAFNQAATFVDVRILEYRGLDTSSPLDVTAGGAGSGTSANSGAATTTSASELIFGAGMTWSSYTAAGTGFTVRAITSPDADIAEDQAVTVTGSYSAAATTASSKPWVMQMATFRASGQGTTNPAPTVSSISPTSGTTAGGTGVTITGMGFLAGATVSLGGSAATGVTVASSTSITATTASHAAGTVNVVVSNPDAQSGTLASGYSYTTTNPAPTVSSISPTSGTTAGGTGVTITGTGFLAGATVSLGGSAATGVTVASSTSITATTASHAAGTVNVVVSNPDAQSGTLTNGYSYTSSTGGGGIGFVQVNAATPQTASASVPVTFGVAQTAGNLNIVAVGWNDTTSTVSSVSDSRGNSYAQAGTMVTGTGLRQAIYYAKNIIGGSNTVTVAFNQAATFVDVRILEYRGLDTSSPLDVTAGGAGSGTSANSGAATTTSASELIFGAGMTWSSYTAAGTGFTVRAITSPDADIAEDQAVTVTGSYSAAATTASSKPWVMQMATFRASGQGTTNPAPTVSSISPTSGTTAGGTGVTITGMGFLAGATVSLGGSAATGVTVASGTSITATTASHAAGTVNVVVSNPDAQSGTLASGYSYTTTNPAPTVSSISPTSGTTAGGTGVTITGTGFLAGATVSLGGSAATGVTVVSSTSITATTASHAAGTVNVVVTNPDAQSGTLTNGYSYTSSTGGGGIGFVQVNAATPQTASASVPVTFGVAQTAGNLNIVAVGWNDTTSTVSSVSDSRGNSYAQAGTMVTGTGLRQAIYYAKNIIGGSNTVTVAFNQAATFVDVRILEYRGLDTSSPLDVTAGGAGSGTSANSGAATTTSASELIFGAGMTWSSYTAAGTGFTVRAITSPDADIAEDQAVTVTGSYSAAATTASSKPWVMQMATFKAKP